MTWCIALLSYWLQVTLGELLVKSKLSPRTGSVALRQLNSIFLILSWGLRYSLKKRGQQSNVDIDIRVKAPAAKQYCGLRKISYIISLLFCCLATYKRVENSFFYLLPGYPTDNFGSLLRGQPLLPDINHCILTFFTCLAP